MSMSAQHTTTRRGAIGLLAGAGAAGALLLHSTATGAAPPSGALAVFDVRDFGAVGDWDPTSRSGTDDRTAIRTAAAACSANGGGILYFPSGRYGATLGSSGTGELIRATDDMHIVFDPAAELHVISTDLAAYRVIDISSGAANVSVRFARIFGDAATNRTGGSGHRAISMGRSTNTSLHWCELRTIKGIQVAIGEEGPSSQTTVEGCLFDGAFTGGYGLVGLGVFDSSDLVVTNCTFQRSQHGLRASPITGTSTTETRIFACHFGGNGHGVSLAGPGSTENVEVFANTFVGNLGTAVTTGAIDGSITANSIRGNGSHGIRVTGGSQTIVGNSLVGNGGYGISLAAGSSLVVGNRTARNIAGTVTPAGTGSVVANNL